MQLEDGTTIEVVPDHTRCPCGEHLAPGERVGRTREGRFICLRCIADRRAGRTPPRRRRSTTPMVPVHVPPPARAWEPPRPARRGPRTGRSLLMVAAIVIGALAVDVWAFADDSILGSLGLPLGRATSEASGTTRGGAGTAGSGDHAFLFTRGPGSTEPVTFSSCAPIHLVVNKEAAPPHADRLLREAVRRVHEVSGLELVIDGDTDELASDQRRAEKKGLLGGYAPVLVAWTTPQRISGLEGTVVGLGGPREAPAGTQQARRFVSGIVYLDGPSLAQMMNAPDGQAQARAVIMHELGHMLGLAHVTSQSELMASRNESHITDFGPGDREGLRRLGSGPCF